MKAYQPIQDTMGGSTPMPFVYLEKRVAEIWAKDHEEPFIGYQVRTVEVRQLTDNEGAVGAQLVEIRRDSAVALIKAKALAKLTPEEREALGVTA